MDAARLCFRSMRKYPLLFLWLFLLSAPVARGQQYAMDSLRGELAVKELTTFQRIRTLGQLARITAIDAPKAGLPIAFQAMELAKKDKSDLAYASAYASLSQVYLAMDSTDLAAQNIDSALYFADRSGDKVMQGLVWYRKGKLDNFQDHIEASVSSFLKAIELLEGSNDYATLGGIYYFMAGTYGDEGDLASQEKYARLCLDAARKSGLPDDLCNGYQTMASSFEYRFRKDSTNKVLLRDCMKYNGLAYTTALRTRNKLNTPSIIAVVALNMADVYAAYYPPSYRDSAIYYINIALKTGQETGQKTVVASCFGQLSDYAVLDGDYKKAESYLLEALAVVNSQAIANGPVRLHIMQNLGHIAEQRGDKTKALDYYKSYMEYYKNFFDAAQLAAAKKLEARYETEKKERALLVAQQQAAFNKKLNVIYVVLIIACLLALLFLFRAYHFRLRASIEKQKLLQKEKEDVQLKADVAASKTRELELQKKEAELSARLQQEETARLHAEQQLLEARKQFLQKELLAGSLELEEKNDLLQSLQKKITEIGETDPRLRKVGRIITERTRLDEDFESLKQDFAQIHPGFVIQLQEKAQGGLTRVDLKYCTYILMGLSNKEIGVRLGIEAKSIRMARYRIKQKLGLDKDENLDQFIRTLA